MASGRVSAATLAAVLLLNGCNGGSGGSPGDGGGGNTVNQPPTAAAGGDRLVDEGSGVTLTGSGSDTDGGPLTFLWRQVSGPPVTLNSTTGASLSFTAPQVSQQSVLVFELKVTDQGGLSDTDQAAVTVRDIPPPTPPVNHAPVASAGADQQVNALDTVELDGTGSIDPDSDALTFSWSQSDGPAVSLSGAASSTAQFTAAAQPAAYTLRFNLLVTDSHGAQATDSIVVAVNAAPGAPTGQWLRGDLHVHDDHSSDGSLPRQTIGQGAPGNTSVADQIFWAELMQLDFLPLTDHRTFDQHYDPQWRSNRLLLITGEEANSRPHAIVLGALDTIVQADNPPGAPEFRKLQQSIWDAHLQGAAWSTAHPDDGEMNDDGSPNSFAFATGPDLVEIWNRGTLNRAKIAYCESRWNAGYRFGVAGASDDHFKELWLIAGPGTPTTQVFAHRRNTPALLEALRGGRTAVNLDALAPSATLEADFQGDGIFEAIGGDEVQVPAGRQGKLRVTVKNAVGAKVNVYRMPGMAAGVFASFQPSAPAQTFEIDVTADRAQDWYRVELRGPGEPDSVDYSKFLAGDPVAALDPDLSNQLRAITSPIFVSTGALAKPESPELPADRGAADGAELLAGESRDNAFAGFAAVAEADGILHAVVEERSGGASRVVYRQRGASGFTNALVLSGDSVLARLPRVAAAGGHVWVTWQDSRAGEIPHQTQILTRHSADGGATWEPIRQVSASAARAEHADIALLSPTLPLVVWQDNGGGAFDVYARVIGRDTAPVNLSAAGKSISSGVLADTRSAIYPASVHPRVAIRSDGLMAVAWQDNRYDIDPGWTGHRTDNPQDEEGTDPDDWEILVATRAASAPQWSAARNASNSPTLADRHPALAFDAGGALRAAWDSKTLESAGPRPSIRAASSADSGQTWDLPAPVALAPEFNSQRPVFGVNGNALSLFWMDGRSSDWRWRVMRADLSEGAWTNARMVTGAGNSAWPSYSHGWLAVTSDRNATREQRKPQQAFLLSLDVPQAAVAPNGNAVPAMAEGDGSSFDLCLPLPGGPCLSQLWEIGSFLLSLLEPLFGDDGIPLADVTEAAGEVLSPIADACSSSGAPEWLCAPLAPLDPARGLTRYVDPRIGSFPPGFTNPGPVLPFGMVALGPDTEGPLNYGGYSVQNLLITGFSHVHMSAGVFKAGQFPVMPFTGELTAGDLNQLGWPGTVPAYASPFDRATEIATPGYYSALLARYAVLAELTATERAGLHRYTFQDPQQPPRLLLHLSRSNGGYSAASASLRSDGTLTGKVHHDDAGGFDIYFAARADRPFVARTSGGAPLGNAAVSGGDLGVVLTFDGAAQTLMLKLALSYTDEQGAIGNLDAEMPGWDFDSVRAAAQSKWNDALARIEVEGGTEAERISFYSALYRALQFPNLHSDANGRYRGPDGEIHSDTRPHYSQFSSWDSYRGQNALQAELLPDVYGDMVRSLLAFHQQAAPHGGGLPRWQQGPGDASHMSGDPIIPFIGEAWCRGQLPAELRAQLWPALQNLVTRRDPELAERGYLSVPKPANPLEQIAGGSGRAGTTLEYGIADFSLALMAQSAAPAEAGAIARRALNYRNLQDAESGWIRPRLADGSQLTPFYPELNYGFQEGTSWQYSWLAMHDYAGLIAGMGGDDTVNQRLDTFFAFPASLAPLAVPLIQNQATAFGTAYYGNQYAPGNEHDLEAPYVYNYAGAPWKAQAVARAAASIYTPTPLGLPGNDDLGALSGWLVWTMAGLYPVNPGTPLYVVGSPHFEKATLHRPGGDLVIEAPGASLLNRFVNGMQVNGVAVPRDWLILPRAATSVRFSTNAVPDMTWGAGQQYRPPSLSTHTLADFGCAP